MNLSDYIKKVGTKRAAAQFGVAPKTVQSWRYGYRYPRPDKANEIVQLTGGEVSLAGIYAQPSKPNGKRAA